MVAGGLQDNNQNPPADDASLLVVLVDASAAFWDVQHGGGSKTFSLRKFFEQLVVFVNSFLLLHTRNRVAVVSMDASGCHFLYETPGAEGDSGKTTKAASDSIHSGSIGDQIFQNLKNLEVSIDPEKAAKPPSLSGALSVALCYAQRMRRVAGAAGGLSPRILCLMGCPDPAAQYISVMNCLFSAQRANVVVDGCVLGNAESAFLQQAAHLTGGLYLRPPRLEGLLQYLHSVFAVDVYSRRFLEMPRSKGVDFRASCFCHKRSIDIGFVCSVCLSIFCQPCTECSTCGTRYDVKPAQKRQRQ
mmetsp:Transcript_6669/g.11489  ORF Transcript_6669/g.11489 Transcript_6669/m.11489 type:complete len:302 (-) Transcript_6669:239-1144(-)